MKITGASMKMSASADAQNDGVSYQIPRPMRIKPIVIHPRRPTEIIVSKLMTNVSLRLRVVVEVSVILLVRYN